MRHSLVIPCLVCLLAGCERVKPAAIVLVCQSKPYFHSRLSALGCRSLLLTTNFVAPEAYTLEAAL